HFHLHFPLGGFEGHILDAPRCHQSQKLLIKFQIFHAPRLADTPGEEQLWARPTPILARASAAERSENRRAALNPWIRLVRRLVPLLQNHMHPKSSEIRPMKNHPEIPEEPETQ